MRTEVEVRNVQNIALSAKFGETGDLQHELRIKCVLDTGDMERILLMCKERVKSGAPIILMLVSPQAKMDLFVSQVDVEITGATRSAKRTPQPETVIEAPLLTEMVAIEDVNMTISEENGKDVFNCRIGELLGKADCPRDAILDVLMGQDVAHGFRLQDNAGLMVEQVEEFMTNKFPGTPALCRLLWALVNNSFDIPEDLDKPKRKKKEPVSV